MEKCIRISVVVLAMLLGLVSCKKDEPAIHIGEDEEEGPTAADQAMIKEQATYELDSIFVEYFIDSPDYVYETLKVEDEDISPRSYTFYPSTYNFPSDLYFTSEWNGNKVYFAENYDEAYCKYTMTYEGTFVQGGYVQYYNNLFTLNGMKTGAWMVFSILDSCEFTSDKWVFSYNATVEDDGSISERDTQYYHKVN